MFGDPRSNPRSLPAVPLGDIATLFAGASLPAGVPFEGQDGGHFLLKVSDMNRAGNEMRIDSCAAWAEPPGARSATSPAGSIVFPKRGGAIGTNKKRITTRPSILDPNLMAVDPQPGSVGLEYLFQWFLFLDLAEIATGSSVPQLNKRDLRPLQVPLPSLAAQETFAGCVHRVAGLRVRGERQSNHIDTLVASLQARAFAGEL